MCETVISAIRGGAAQSWQMENRWETMRDGKFDYGFAVDWMRKDLGICLKTASDTGARLPVTALVDQFYAEVQPWVETVGTPPAWLPACGTADKS